MGPRVAAARRGATSSGWARASDDTHARLVAAVLNGSALDVRGPRYLAALAGDRAALDDCRTWAAQGDELAATITEWATHGDELAAAVTEWAGQVPPVTLDEEETAGNAHGWDDPPQLADVGLLTGGRYANGPPVLVMPPGMAPGTTRIGRRGTPSTSPP